MLDDSSQLRDGDTPLVLVVDDHEDARELWSLCVEDAGYRVAVAKSGEEALALVASAHPSAIVMDIAMPGIDGIETTRRLKADAKTRDIVILGVSGQGPDALRAMRAAGAADVCTKPCMPADFMARLVRLMPIARTTTRTPQPPLEPSSPGNDTANDPARLGGVVQGSTPYANTPLGS